MEKQPFTSTLHCTSKAHCKVCRNLVGGREWRRSISNNFSLPQVAEGTDPADFECPYGEVWNKDPIAKRPMAQAKAQATPTPTPPCRGCAEKTERVRAERTAQTRSATGGCGCSKNK